MKSRLQRRYTFSVSGEHLTNELVTQVCQRITKMFAGCRTYQTSGYWAYENGDKENPYLEPDFYKGCERERGVDIILVSPDDLGENTIRYLLEPLEGTCSWIHIEIEPVETAHIQI